MPLRSFAFLLVSACCFVTSLAGSVRAVAGVARSAVVTPLAPICPTILQTWVIGRRCFPQRNGNQSRSTTGDQEIDGAALSGPHLLPTGPCPQPHKGYVTGAWCTPEFTLSLSVPGSAGGKIGGWSMLGQPLVGTSVVLPDSRHLCPTCWTESLGLASPGAVGYGAWWCLQAANPGWAHGGKCGTVSDPMRIAGQGNHYSTMAVCALGIDSFYKVSIANYKNSFTACIQIQLAPGGVAPPPTRRSAASLLVDLSSPHIVPGKSVPLGKTGRVTATVEALGGAVHGISLGKGLLSSSNAAVVVSRPPGLSRFTLTRGMSRRFLFEVKTEKPGRVSLSVNADGKTSSGAAVHGSGELAATVGKVGIVVNTTSDAPRRPEGARGEPPRCVSRPHGPERALQSSRCDPGCERARREPDDRLRHSRGRYPGYYADLAAAGARDEHDDRRHDADGRLGAALGSQGRQGGRACCR